MLDQNLIKAFWNKNGSVTIIYGISDESCQDMKIDSIAFEGGDLRVLANALSDLADEHEAEY